MIRKQRLSQICAAIVYNSYILGFFSGNIYQGVAKYIPCPGLNCHSCPAALFTCPIGAIQLFAAFGTYYVSFYVLGFLGLIGALGGRIVCGWACPFGLLQDIAYKIPSPSVEIPRLLERTKYVVLAGVVLFLAWYTKEPWFCKLICPAGTLEAGIPLLCLNTELRVLIDKVFIIKIGVLLFFLAAMIISKRPFCRTVCPLGAVYGLFNMVSMFKMRFKKKRCIMDKKCSRVCPVSHRRSLMNWWLMLR